MWRRLSAIAVIGTVIYATFPFALDGWEDRERIGKAAMIPFSWPVETETYTPTPTPTAIPTATATWTPASLALPIAVGPVNPSGETPPAPPVDIPPQVATLTPTATVTPTATTTPTATITPTTEPPNPCNQLDDVNPCPDTPDLKLPNPDEGAAIDDVDPPAIMVTPTPQPVE